MRSMADVGVTFDEGSTHARVVSQRTLSALPWSADLGKKLARAVFLWRGDITRLRVDAIVNAANSRLLGGGGVDGAIHRAAGPELLESCRRLNGCDTGHAKSTAGFALPAAHVIHTVGPMYYSHSPQAADKLLRSCYRSVLREADQLGVKSLALCSVSTGVYGYPVEEASCIALEEVRKHLVHCRAADNTNGKEALPAAAEARSSNDLSGAKEDTDSSSGGATFDSRAMACVDNSDGDGLSPSRSQIERVVFCVFDQAATKAYASAMPAFFPADGIVPVYVGGSAGEAFVASDGVGSGSAGEAGDASDGVGSGSAGEAGDASDGVGRLSVDMME